ncbi:hypothetical protein T439DRAFT_331051 [Meredithblackwellia eburnea MCA 4105]
MRINLAISIVFAFASSTVAAIDQLNIHCTGRSVTCPDGTVVVGCKGLSACTPSGNPFIISTPSNPHASRRMAKAKREECPGIYECSNRIVYRGCGAQEACVAAGGY